MSNKSVTVLLQVLERHSKASLLPLEEQSIQLAYDEEQNFLIEDRAKGKYLIEIKKRIKYEPSVNKALTGKDWFIDCTVL